MCPWCSSLETPYYNIFQFNEYIKEFNDDWNDYTINSTYVVVCKKAQYNKLTKLLHNSNSQLSPISLECESYNGKYVLLYLRTNIKIPFMTQFYLPRVFEPKFSDDCIDSLCQTQPNCTFIEANMDITEIQDDTVSLMIRNPHLSSWNEILKIVNV